MENQIRPTLIMICLLFIPLATQAQKKTNHQFLSQIGVRDSIYSLILGESREIYIHLPRDYNPDKDHQYPVAFILDGEIFLPTVAQVQDYYSGGFTPEMILVGISNAHHRTRDLTTSQVNQRFGMPFKEENGMAESFLNFIEKELIPYIEKKYPVTNYRTLIGHSYGGLFTLYTLIHKPSLFANYLAIDPSLDWDDQLILKEAEIKFPKANYDQKFLFVSLGGQLHMQESLITLENVMLDTTEYTLFARSNIAFSEIVKKNSANKLAFDWKFYPKDLHGTIPFPSIMDGLISIFEWYQMENTHKINSFSTSTKELLEIINYREEKLKRQFGYSVPPYPEDLLNMSGYMNLEMNQLDKAKIYFEFAIKFFPNSANAYDSMSDYYEAEGDIRQALRYARKAAEISNVPYYQEKVAALTKKKNASK